MQKLILGAMLLFVSSNSYAVAVASGEAVINVATRNSNCEQLKEVLSASLEQQVRQIAKLDADSDCNQIYPGTNASKIQRIRNQRVICNESGQFEVNFAAIYFCGH